MEGGSRSRRQARAMDAEAQVHVLEMVTLFWLFFMSATFLIQLKVPDPVTPLSDANLLMAGDDALVQAAVIEPLDPANQSSRLGELLSSGATDAACQSILDALRSSVEGNCWLAQDSSASMRYGTGSSPLGETVTLHRLLHTDGKVWTISLEVWHVGGG
uniref:Uncharacterized protein n=1 Tax=uncultured marine group II/III euryarchaeote KM3_109_G01 TaxID=1457850 RepID=A0A075G5R1_9EURY|nr:hypothetical protein [uncultured marine group II/III euryarchaeote KM3_109_G01]